MGTYKDTECEDCSEYDNGYCKYYEQEIIVGRMNDKCDGFKQNGTNKWSLR